MRGRLVEAAVLSLLAAGAVWAGAWDNTEQWFAPIGALVLSALAVISWLSIALMALLRARRQVALPTTPSLELVARPEGFRYPIAAFFALFTIMLLWGLVVRREPQHSAVFAVIPISAAVAVALVAGWTYGISIDGSTRQVARWVGFRIGPRAFPFHVRIHEISAGKHVDFAETVRSTNKNGSAGQRVFTVHLDAPNVLLGEHPNADVARLRAEDIAKTLGLDLVDRTALDEVRTRANQDLDMPLAQQLRLRGTTNRRDLPKVSRLTLLSPVTPWLVRVEPLGLRTSDVVGMIIATPFLFGMSFVPAAIINVAITRGQPTWDFVYMAALLIAVGLGWFGMVRSVMRTRLGTQHIELSDTRLRVVNRAPGSNSSAELAADSIEEIIVTYDRERGREALCVVARGDGVSLTFGQGLRREDVCWIRDTAIAALAPSRLYR